MLGRLLLFLVCWCAALPGFAQNSNDTLNLGVHKDQLYSFSPFSLLDIRPMAELGYERAITRRLSLAFYPAAYLPYSGAGVTADSNSGRGPMQCYNGYGGRLRADIKYYLSNARNVRRRSTYLSVGFLAQYYHADARGWVERQNGAYRQFTDISVQIVDWGTQVRTGEQVFWGKNNRFFLDYWCGAGIRVRELRFPGAPADLRESSSVNLDTDLSRGKTEGSYLSLFLSGNIRIGIAF